MTPDEVRAATLARWLHLTRSVLPALAAAHAWPIRLDHCFMRVCLDKAVGAPWSERVRRPAIRNLDQTQLARAVRVAEDIVARPETLPALNEESLAARRLARAKALSPGP